MLTVYIDSMKLEEHENSCVKKLGRPFTEVHVFLDQYQTRFGELHRRFLHHRLGLELISNRLGPEAKRAAENHILDDFGFIPNSWIDMVSYTPEPDRRQLAAFHKELVKLYGENEVNKVERMARYKGLYESG